MSDPFYRISDSERDEALSHLRTALEEGRLSVDEHGQRTQEALQALTNDDLRPVFDDLPQQLWPSAVAPPPVPAPAPAATPDTEDTGGVEKQGEEKDRGDGTNLASLAGFGTFLFFIWGLPVINNGGTGAILSFLAVFCLLVVTPAVVQLTRSRRSRHRGIEGS